MVASPAPTAVGSANANWASGVEATLPANAGTNPLPNINSVSCPSAGNCSAVGQYTDSASHQQGLLMSESSGTWAAGVEATLPAGAATAMSPGVTISSVSCPSAGNCAAVGYYLDSSNHTQGLLLSESSGTWAAGVKATLPAGASTTFPNVNIRSVSCPSAGNCAAVGSYVDSSNHQQGLLLSESSGTWAPPVEATLPGNAATSPQVSIGSVSCPSAGNCAAVGDYLDSASHFEGLLLSESSGTWGSGANASPPANAGTDPSVLINSVSCSSAGNCAAGGFYRDNASHGQGLLMSESSGTWASGVEATPPAGAGTDPGAIITSVSCPSAGNCSAVGHYTDSANHQQGLLMSESSGTWAGGVEATLPAAGTIPNVNINSVSCPSAGNCSAVGYYTNSSNHRPGLLVSESSGTWEAGVDSGLPANAGTDPSVDIASVSCPSTGNCAAVGFYFDSSGHQQGLLLGATSASPTLSASAPAGGTAGIAIPASALSATLSGGLAPVGTIAFTVFGPQPAPPGSCGAGGTAVGSAGVAGNAAYHPAGDFTPPSAGEYWWYASYGGDGSDDPAASACGAAMAETVVANPSLKVATAGSGSGTVASSPAGVHCGSSCQAQFDPGTQVILTASAASGSTFAGWRGACSGSDGCKVTMSSDKAVTATFTAKRPPNTKISKAKINQAKNSATFKFKALGAPKAKAASGFQCALVKKKHAKPKFKKCKSPKKYKHLRPHRYTFEVRAFDAAGKDKTPAKKKFKIKR